MSDREPAPLPTAYFVLDPQEVARQNGQEVTDVYAVPMKRKNRLPRDEDADDDTLRKSMEGDPQASMRTTQGVREAMQAVQNMPTFVEETILKTTVARRNENAPSPERSRSQRTRGSGRGFGHRNPRGSLSARQMGRSHSPHQDRDFRESNRDRGGNSVQDRSFTLEVENLRLRDVNQELQTEVTSLRKVAEAVQEGDTQSAESLLLTKQMDELKEEIEVLKSAVHRANVELSRYQARFPPNCLESAGDLSGLPSRGPVPAWLVSKRYLAPLFLAYDDRIREKEEIIRKFERELENLREKTEEVVKENQRLHTRLENPTVTGLGGSDWQQLQEQARLVLEENQVLMEQLDIQQQKVKDMCNAHMQEVSKLAKKLSTVEGEKLELEKMAEEVKGKLKQVKVKCESMEVESQTSVTMEKHITVVQELKRSVVEEKEAVAKELEEGRGKVRAAEEEQRHLARQLASATAENRRLAVEIKSYQKALRKTQQKMTVLLKAMEQSEGKEMITQEQLAKIIRVAEKMALERDTMAKVAKERATENERALERFLESTVAVGKLEEKLKLCKLKAAANINTVTERLKEQDELFNGQKKEYEREITYLRHLVKEKEGALNGVKQDKDAIEEDLEVVWQAANSENQRMKDIMRKSVRRLRQHAGLKEILDSEGEGHQLLDLSSDEGA